MELRERREGPQLEEHMQRFSDWKIYDFLMLEIELLGGKTQVRVPISTKPSEVFKCISLPTVVAMYIHERSDCERLQNNLIVYERWGEKIASSLSTY